MHRRVNPSLVISLLALFIALGGTSYAVSQLPKNSVGTKQLKKNAVTSAKVKDGSLLSRDFRAGQLPRGPVGPEGPAGAEGKTGPSQSIFASNSNLGSPLSDKGVTVTVLNTETDGTGPLLISEDSKLVVDGAVNFYKGIGQATLSADIQCSLFLVPDGAAPTLISPMMRATVGPTKSPSDINPGPANFATVDLAGVAEVSPGFYNAETKCRRTSTSGDSDATAAPVYDGGSLTVVATGI